MQADESSTIATEVREIGDAVCRQLKDALLALETADLVLADTVIRNDSAVNERRWAIEDQVAQNLSAHVVATGSPRFEIAVLSVITDIERIGDYAVGIAKVALMLGNPPATRLPERLQHMGELVYPMLERAVTMFLAQDDSGARELSKHDDEIDVQYEMACEELINSMSKRGHDVVADTYLLWVAHDLERIADRVTNICERTVYLASGKIEDLNSEPDIPLNAEAMMIAARRQNESENGSTTVGEIMVNPKSRTVTCRGSNLELAPREFDLLHYLAAKPGRVFRRQELLDKVWGASFEGESGTVDVHISWLRQKLAGTSSVRITTLRGIGYRLDVLT